MKTSSLIILAFLVSGCNKKENLPVAEAPPIQNSRPNPYLSLPADIRTLLELRDPTDQEVAKISQIFMEYGGASIANDFVNLGNTQAIQKVANSIRYADREPFDLRWLATTFKHANQTSQKEYADRVHQLIKEDPASAMKIFRPPLCVAPYSSKVHQELVLSSLDYEFSASDLRHLGRMVAAQFDKEVHKPFFLRLLKKGGEDAVYSFLADPYVEEQWQTHYDESPVDYVDAGNRKAYEKTLKEGGSENKFRTEPEHYLR